MDGSTLTRLLVAAVLGCLLCSCATESTGARASSSADRATHSSAARSAGPTDPPGARLDPDLRRLADRFVSCAAGESDTFPHRESVSMALGGQTVVFIDDFGAALSSRSIWKTCPADWQVYGASSCPVDLLAPLRNALANDAGIVFSTEHSVRAAAAAVPARSR